MCSRLACAFFGESLRELSYADDVPTTTSSNGASRMIASTVSDRARSTRAGSGFAGLALSPKVRVATWANAMSSDLLGTESQSPSAAMMNAQERHR
jgi:hypothetical protein